PRRCPAARPGAMSGGLGRGRGGGGLGRGRPARPPARGQVYDEEADAAMRAMVEAQVEAESLPFFLSGRLYDDGVIDPRDTRTVLGLCLSAVNSAPVPEAAGYGVFRP
ncbi:acyl-CoA carboxylase subunit beta, partial [Nonomuraea sp. NPDC050691]